MIRIINHPNYTTIENNGVNTNYPKRTLCFQEIPGADKVVIKAANSLTPILTAPASQFADPSGDAASIVAQCASHYDIAGSSGGGGVVPSYFNKVIVPKHVFNQMDKVNRIITITFSAWIINDEVHTVYSSTGALLLSNNNDFTINVELTIDTPAQIVTAIRDGNGNDYYIASIACLYSDQSYYFATVDVTHFVQNNSTIKTALNLTISPPANGIGQPEAMTLVTYPESTLIEDSMGTFQNVLLSSGLHKLVASCRDGAWGMPMGEVYTEIKVVA